MPCKCPFNSHCTTNTYHCWESTPHSVMYWEKDTPSASSTSMQAHSTATLVSFTLMKPSLKALPLARGKTFSFCLLNWYFICSAKCGKSEEGQKTGGQTKCFQDCCAGVIVLRELSSFACLKVSSSPFVSTAGNFKASLWPTLPQKIYKASHRRFFLVIFELLHLHEESSDMDT